MNIRRLSNFIYHYKIIAVLMLSILFLIVHLLIQGGIMCTNYQATRHMSKLCRKHRDGEAVGILCDPLCNTQGIHSLVCETLHAGKETVFSGHWESTRLVFKAARTVNKIEQAESLFWSDVDGLKHYPSEFEFITLIRDLVITKLNYNLTNHQIERLGRLRTSQIEMNPEKRQLEMDNVWPLVHEQEYIMTILFEDNDVFPHLIGTCGTFYAVEYVRPIEISTTILTLSDSKPEWAKRVKIAVMILDFLQELETVFTEPLYLCDIKINHFGLSSDERKLKFLDLDAVFPKSVLNSIVKNNKVCERNEDCDYFDCKSLCSKNMRCESPVVNDNLQIICEKIFLGWTLSGTIIIPGLLMSKHTSSLLATLLRQCGNPAGRQGLLAGAVTPETAKSRLYTTLKQMERKLNNFV